MVHADVLLAPPFLDLASSPSDRLGTDLLERAAAREAAGPIKWNGLLWAAQANARAAVPDLAGLVDDLLPRLPRRPRASQNLRSICRDPSSAPMLVDEAITMPWLAWDSETHRNALLVDIDDDDALDRWLALPEKIRPILALDPWSGRAHAVAVLEDPVLLKTRQELAAERTGGEIEDGARALLGPQMMADLGGRLLAAALGGTLLPPGSLVKNPWGLTRDLVGIRRQIGQRPVFVERWAEIQAKGLMWSTLVGAGPVTLRDLVGALADEWWTETAGASKRFTAARYAKKRGDPSWLSRNTWVFDLTRWAAYDRAEKDGGAILEMAFRFNSELAQPLPTSDIHATARSITRFMNTRFRPRVGSGETRRGRDRVAGADLAPAARKAVAGKATAAARAAATDARIAAAVASLQAAGKPITQAAIAAEAGVGLNTVARRWTQKRNPPNAALSGSAAPAALRGPAPVLPESLNPSPSFPSLAEQAKRDRTIRRAVVALKAVAVQASRPGAVPCLLPELPRDVAKVPAVRVARREAEAALADSRRRSAARAARAKAVARRSEMEARLRQDSAAAWRWWRAEMAVLDAKWDTRESSVDPQELAAVEARREAVFSGRWRSWKAACRSVGAPQPTEVDPAVPW